MSDAHLSIGEVLTLLQDEFPDVTISKIRFLESQGLINPERTPSGYRKFYEPDIERLRWILVQQRENFLPLKVIRERLDAADSNGSTPASPPEASPEPPAIPTEDQPSTDAEPTEDGTEQPGDEGREPRPVTVTASMPAGELDPSPTAAPTDEPTDSDGTTGGQTPIWMADVAANRGAKHVRAAAGAGLTADPTEVSLTAPELCEAAGITTDDLADLERFGMLAGRTYSDDVYYDADALLIAKGSAALLRRGIEVRHLRMYKVAAEREAGFIEQVTVPLLKQRNPEARREAIDLVEELSDLGHDLRAALLRANLRRHLDRS